MSGVHRRVRQQAILVGAWLRSSQAGTDLCRPCAFVSHRTAAGHILNKALAQVTIAPISSITVAKGRGRSSERDGRWLQRVIQSRSGGFWAAPPKRLHAMKE